MSRRAQQGVSGAWVMARRDCMVDGRGLAAAAAAAAAENVAVVAAAAAKNTAAAQQSADGYCQAL
jgi:hypothetical protein